MTGTSIASRAWRGGKNDWRLHALSMFSLSVAFVCLASALLVVVNLDALQTRWARAGRASVYLKDGATEEEIASLRRALASTRGVTAAHFVSPAEARREVVGDVAESSLAALPLEAFPASIEVELAPTVTDDELASIGGKLRALPTVESVETYQRWTDRLGALLKGGVAAGALLAAVVLGAVVSVVASTMRLALQRRQLEVEVLKLVGATDGYVRGPFVLEGAAQGAVGATAALALLAVLYLIVRQRFDADLAMLVGVTPVFLPWTLVVGMIALGALLGAAAAYAGVRRLSAV